MKQRVEKQIGKMLFWFETGELAKQAAGSCLCGYGDSLVIDTVTIADPREGQDFFPLTCDYRERFAAAGKFPGGFLKREGKPSLKETLTARLMDRPIRPLFPDGYCNEIQIQSFVLASDRQHDTDILAMNGASMALCLSPAPFMGPISAVRLARINGELVPFPSQEELEESDLDLVISGSDDSIVMIEGFAREMPEAEMLECVLTAHKYIKELNALQREMIDLVKPVKSEFTPIEDCTPVYEAMKSKYYNELAEIKRTEGKLARAAAVDDLKSRIKADLIPDPEADGAISDLMFGLAWEKFEQRVVRDFVLAGKRLDGRGLKDIRPIECRVGVLPRVHGSAVFQRGETQALVTVTLGTARDDQRIDGLFEEYSKKFMLDYNFPPFAVGECKPLRGPGRREYGHGALAERSVRPVVPENESFPYTIRVISDIMESNGSSSMASVCGATLGLMDAGVPISNPVAGISIGLVKETNDNWTIMTDIVGDEDHFCDMDFKIAGTQNGITGIQLDLKIDGITPEMIEATLAQARQARIQILRTMLRSIHRPRKEISKWAPRLLKTQIDPSKIGLLIGPGGKTIRGIQEMTGASIDIEEDGTVTIASETLESAEEALGQVEALSAKIEIGRVYNGKVISIKHFGAFVEIVPGRDGLVHVSELSDGYVNTVADVCKIGQMMKVKVIGVDDHDRIKLSRKAVLIDEKKASADGSADSDN